jgi:hypothetical protein
MSCQALLDRPSVASSSGVSLALFAALRKIFVYRVFFRKGLGFDKQPAPSERFGAGFEIGELITRGETEDHSARAGLNIFFHPIDHFIPRAGNTEHRVCHRLVRPVVVLGKKGLSFDNSLFATGS